MARWRCQEGAIDRFQNSLPIAVAGSDLRLPQTVRKIQTGAAVSRPTHLRLSAQFVLIHVAYIEIQTSCNRPY
jgi:hypothetical protein